MVRPLRIGDSYGFASPDCPAKSKHARTDRRHPGRSRTGRSGPFETTCVFRLRKAGNPVAVVQHHDHRRPRLHRPHHPGRRHRPRVNGPPARHPRQPCSTFNAPSLLFELPAEGVQIYVCEARSRRRHRIRLDPQGPRGRPAQPATATSSAPTSPAQPGRATDGSAVVAAVLERADSPAHRRHPLAPPRSQRALRHRHLLHRHLHPAPQHRRRHRPQQPAATPTTPAPKSANPTKPPTPSSTLPPPPPPPPHITLKQRTP